MIEWFDVRKALVDSPKSAFALARELGTTLGEVKAVLEQNRDNLRVSDSTPRTYALVQRAQPAKPQAPAPTSLVYIDADNVNFPGEEMASLAAFSRETETRISLVHNGTQKKMIVPPIVEVVESERLPDAVDARIIILMLCEVNKNVPTQVIIVSNDRLFTTFGTVAHGQIPNLTVLQMSKQKFLDYMRG